MSRALVIGYGSIGRRHAAVLQRLGYGVTVVSKHEPEAAYADVDTVDDWEFYDYIVIASETGLHASQMQIVDHQAPQARVLVEKPLLVSCEQFFQPRNNAIYVGYNLRFHPVIQALGHVLRGQTLLTLTVQAGQYLPNWRPDTDYRQSYSASVHRGGGVLLDLSHEIDYVLWLVGSLSIKAALCEQVSDLAIESEDVCSFVGKAQDGAVVTVTLDYLSRQPIRRITAVTVTETIVADLIAGTLAQNGVYYEQIPKGPVERDYTYTQMHQDVLMNPQPQACTFAEGMRVNQTIDHIRQIAGKGKGAL